MTDSERDLLTQLTRTVQALQVITAGEAQRLEALTQRVLVLEQTLMLERQLRRDE